MWLTKLAHSVPLGVAGCVAKYSLFGIAIACAGTAAAAEQPLYTVLNPTGNPPPIELRAMAPRPASLSGKTVYLVDETFDGGDKFLQADAGVDGRSYARRQDRVPGEEGLVCRR